MTSLNWSMVRTFLIGWDELNDEERILAGPNACKVYLTSVKEITPA